MYFYRTKSLNKTILPKFSIIFRNLRKILIVRAKKKIVLNCQKLSPKYVEQRNNKKEKFSKLSLDRPNIMLRMIIINV